MTRRAHGGPEIAGSEGNGQPRGTASGEISPKSSVERPRKSARAIIRCTLTLRKGSCAIYTRPTPGRNALRPIGPCSLPGFRGPALALAVLLGLTSCALYPDLLKRPPVHLRWVTILADERMNEDFPVALDLVVAYDEDLITRLEAMPAADW